MFIVKNIVNLNIINLNSDKQNVKKIQVPVLENIGLGRSCNIEKSVLCLFHQYEQGTKYSNITTSWVSCNNILVSIPYKIALQKLHCSFIKLSIIDICNDN